MFAFLLPREENFFDYFERHAALTHRAAQQLLDIARNPNPIHEKSRHVREIEHEGDTVTRECMEALHKTFITPIDRSDIHALIKSLDDILDQIDHASRAMALFEVTGVEPELEPMTRLLVEATEQTARAVKGLRTLDSAQILEACRLIHKVESEVDALFDRAIARLFKDGSDPLKVIKWQELFGDVETSTDFCQEVANILEGIVVEHA